MALPTKTDLVGMDYSFKGSPFVDTVGNSSVNTFTMDWSFVGAPFVRNGAGGAAITPRRTLLGVGS